MTGACGITSLPWDQEETPDFMLIDGEGRALLLHVRLATSQQARLSPQSRLLGLEVETETPGEKAEQILHSFAKQVYRHGVPRSAIAAAVVFPSLSDTDISVIQQAGIKPDFSWLSKDWIDGRGVSSWRGILSDSALDDESLGILRAQFTPEVIVSPGICATCLASKGGTR